MIVSLVLLIIFFVIIVISKSNKANHQSKISTHKFVSRSGVESTNYSENVCTSPRPTSNTLGGETDLDGVMSDFLEDDYLGKAAEAGCKAKKSLKDKEFDKAWRLFHEQKNIIWSMQIKVDLVHNKLFH